MQTSVTDSAEMRNEEDDEEMENGQSEGAVEKATKSVYG